MNPSHLLPLLRTISNVSAIETYTHFPDVIKAGRHYFEKEEVAYLLTEDLIGEVKRDSFGAWLQLTTKGRIELNKE